MSTNSKANIATTADQTPVNGTPIPTELRQLEEDLEKLAWLLKSVSIELPQLARLVTALLAMGFEIRRHGGKIDVLDWAGREHEVQVVQSRVLMQATYQSVDQHLTEALALRESLQTKLAELPSFISANLPTKNGLPWRSFYLRECLDVMYVWPLEVANASAFLGPEINTADLVNMMTARSRRRAFPLHERLAHFGRVLEEAVSDLKSLRCEFAAIEPGDVKQAAPGSCVTNGQTSVETSGETVKAKKKIKPTPDTLKVIRCIEKGHSNEEVQTLVKTQHGITKTVDNVRQIRSRFNAGDYVV